MMPPPLPIALAVIVLVGWPTVKFAATAMARSIWCLQKKLKAELEADPAYGDFEHRIIEDEFQEGKGTPAQLALPFVALFGGIAAAVDLARDAKRSEHAESEMDEIWREIIRIRYPNGGEATRSLMEDPRFKKMRENTMLLEALRYPFSSILTGIFLIPSAVLMLCMLGLNAAAKKAIRILISSQGSIRLFDVSVAGHYRS